MRRERERRRDDRSFWKNFLLFATFFAIQIKLKATRGGYARAPVDFSLSASLSLTDSLSLRVSQSQSLRARKREKSERERKRIKYAAEKRCQKRVNDSLS